MRNAESSLKPYHGMLWVGWFVLLLLFLLAGTLGHDPWKQDETYSFGIIYHFYTAHTWLIPVNAGMPFMEKPPLYYWTAAVLCKWLTGIVPLPDAARLASVLYMMISCLSLWASSRILFESHAEPGRMGYTTVALFLGCFGVARHAHDMFTDVALLAGASITLLGMIMLVMRPRQWLRAALAIGLGTGMTFLSKGLAVPLMFGASGMILIVLLPQLRTRQTAATLLIAFCVASPFLLIWPYLLYKAAPPLFTEWFWNNNIGRFLGFSVSRLGADNTPGYMAVALLWFAFPAFPLACVAVDAKRREWRTPKILIPLALCATGLVILLSSASARALYLLPLMPAFALLGAQGLVHIPTHLLALWNAGVRILGSIAALIIIAIWVCLLQPQGPQPFAWVNAYGLPLGFIPDGQTIACITASVFVVAWVACFRLNIRSWRDTALLWFAAVALQWGLGTMLLTPWADQTRSFRFVIEDINRVVNQPPYTNACIARHNLGESVSPMWEYFGNGRGLGPVEGFRDEAARCFFI